VEGSVDRILVRDFVLPVEVGAYEFERHKSQRVRFSVEAEVRRRVLMPKDMRDVFSYDIILDIIRTLVGRGHTVLVETLAEQAAERILQHEEILSVMVRVEKLDLGPGAVGVEIVRRRQTGLAR
jgi:dihydroneopterin aldolase